ncbi:phosphopantetheine binding protein [Anaerobacterium chartisolvens]|uniref:Phosphopantetheine binding protein n=1 Tax=Anaerobacterium chartisolvens TaxID=1297424 RepID=A0A369B6V6_9FIRM|nr:phosphopantetheine-binding protein [Anaerobacterium chartisolvens]RCX17250.1 phosphopantetheine binding protein [Anaerobacterium chartisolvens]
MLEDNKKEAAGIYVPVTDGTQFIVMKAWEEVLQVNRHLGIKDNFFELGGDPIKADLIAKRIKNIGLTAQDVLENPTIERLAQILWERTSYIEKGDMPRAMRENLDAEYYFCRDGSFDEFTQLLDCNSLMYYFYLKRYVKDYAKYVGILMQDISVNVSLNPDGSLCNIWCDNFDEVDELFKAEVVNGKGYESMADIERLLEQGKIVVIKTYTKKLPFNKDFISLDFEVTDLQEEIEKSNHTFIAVAHDDEMLYYIEVPAVLNDRFIPYGKNKSVGVIKKTDLKPAFDLDLIFASVDIDTEKLARGIDIKDLLRKSISNYFKPCYYNNGFKVYCGFEAMEMLKQIFESEGLCLDHKHSYYKYIDVKGFLDWKLWAVLARKMLLKEMLEQYRDIYPEFSRQNLNDDLSELVEEWKRFRMKVIYRYFKGDFIAGKIYLKHINKIIAMERNVVKKLEEVL